ncbi:hypothetical protein FKM82_027392 [Ascaphus truei]
MCLLWTDGQPQSRPPAPTHALPAEIFPCLQEVRLQGPTCKQTQRTTEIAALRPVPSLHQDLLCLNKRVKRHYPLIVLGGGGVSFR